MKPSNARLCDCRQREQRQPSAAANLVAFGAKAKFGARESLCKKNWLWWVRTTSLQARALPGASILRTLIIRPPMISTLTILMLMILELTVSTHLISTHLISVRMVSTHTISTLTILGMSEIALSIVRQSSNPVTQWGKGDQLRIARQGPAARGDHMRGPR